MKKCPFCGSDLNRLESWVVYEGHPGEHTEYAIMCCNCGAQGPNDLGQSGAEEMWDLRRPMYELQQERDDLLAALEGIDIIGAGVPFVETGSPTGVEKSPAPPSPSRG